MTQTLEKEAQESTMKRLKNKVAVITGGTRGIGKGIARVFAKEGAKVIITGRGESHPAADELNAELGADGVDQPGADPAQGEVKYYQCDVSNAEAVKAFVAKVLEDFESIDVLINNAGITADNLYARMKPEEWENVVNTNLNSLFYICQPTVRAMSKKRDGVIINMTSVVGVHGNPGQVNYSASKAGMIGFTKSLAKEYGRRNIRVNAIAPGFIKTEMTEELPEEQRKQYAEHVPLGDFGQVEDIAQLALFLATDAKYITGQVIQVDGGLFM